MTTTRTRIKIRYANMNAATHIVMNTHCTRPSRQLVNIGHKSSFTRRYRRSYRPSTQLEGFLEEPGQ